MSVATELTRITNDRNSIRTKMVELGVALNTDNLTQLATKINTIENKGAVDAQVKEGETYTIPAGYHNGSGTVSGVSGGGNYNLQSKAVTPTKTQQSITSDDGYYGLSSVVVEPIPDTYQDVSSTTAAAGDVLANKTFVAADGTLTAGTIAVNGDTSATFDPMSETEILIPSGYTSGGTISLTNDLETALAAI